MKKFRCTVCKYEFYSRNKERILPPKRCPYCSKEGTISEKRHVLEEL